ncbi:MAG: hypothetical protein R3325_15755, partial [Thermoanaerobaculia bacterium]|nr:hypothetical protein [Thermoanaerobaculia bacterium]
MGSGGSLTRRRLLQGLAAAPLAARGARAAPTTGPRVVVVGAGASALEVAANLSAGPVADAAAPRVTVVADGPVVPVFAD